jgi:hypothetical protein
VTAAQDNRTIRIGRFVFNKIEKMPAAVKCGESATCRWPQGRREHKTGCMENLSTDSF